MQQVIKNITQSTTNNHLSLYSLLGTRFGLSMAIILEVSDKGICIMMADFVTDVHMLSQHTTFSINIVKLFKIQTSCKYFSYKNCIFHVNICP
jgi:hypothetical protein